MDMRAAQTAACTLPRMKRTLLVDDFDGVTPASTIRFSLAGESYDIDLSEENLAELRETLEPWTTVARAVKPRRSARRPGKKRGGSNTEIREWAKSAGVAVSERGPIPNEVRAKYDAR